MVKVPHRCTHRGVIGVAIACGVALLYPASLVKLHRAYYKSSLRHLMAYYSVEPVPSIPLKKKHIHPIMIDYQSGARLSGSISVPLEFVNQEEEDESSDEETTEWRINYEQRKAGQECRFRDWHYKETYMHCNAIHEIRLVGGDQDSSVEFIHCGSSRCVFRLDHDGQEIALKMEGYHHNIVSPRVRLQHRKDAMTMERLSASHYIPDMYAACSSTQMVEYASHGNLHDFIKLNRIYGSNMTSLDKLRICLQLAEGVAAIHSIEQDGVPSIAHDDLDCQQFVHIDGVFKLNDFHYAEYIPKNVTSNGMCRMTPKGGWREHYYKTRPVEAFDRSTKADLTKIDSYGLGVVMYYVLTNKWMWEGESPKKVKYKCRRGERLPLDREIRESQDPSIVAIRSALSHCWIHDPEERATSKRIRDHLRAALKNITGVKELDDVVRVSIPPLPRKYRFTESDYRSAYYE